VNRTEELEARLADSYRDATTVLEDYREALFEGLHLDPEADDYSPLALKGMIYGLEMRGDNLQVELNLAHEMLQGLCDAAKWACRFGDTDSMRQLRRQVEEARKLLNGGA
jgi:hypothetical protein